MQNRSSEDRRRADLAKIHIAKKELALDDDTYRDMLRAVTGRDSSAGLTAGQRAAVLNHLVKRGWQPPAKTKKHGRRPHTIKGTSRSAQLKKIEALLTIGNRPWRYADVLARQICKVDTIAWVKEDDLYKIITALRKQAIREGWELIE